MGDTLPCHDSPGRRRDGITLGIPVEIHADGLEKWMILFMDITAFKVSHTTTKEREEWVICCCDTMIPIKDQCHIRGIMENL